MATKIVTKNSSTASAVPTASDLVQGELAVNVADKRLFTEDNGGSIVELGTNPSTIDIDAGSIDGTAIGASSASTGAFTTLTASGLTVDTDTLYVDSTNNRVGIGTTSPSRTLHLKEAVPAIRLEDTDVSGVYHEIISEANTGYCIRVDEGNVSSGSYFRVDIDNSEKMRIDSSGNVGIGTSSPSAPLDVDGSGTGIDLANFGGSAQTNFSKVNFNTDALSSQAYIIAYGSGNAESGNVAIKNTNSSGDIFFTAGNTERMRIDSSGNVLVGSTNTDPAVNNVEGFSYKSGNEMQVNRFAAEAAIFGRGSNNGAVVGFRRSGTAVGSISVTASSTAYNTSSDYRLKENVVELTGATERLKQLNPSRFNFIADADTTVDGFLAHEVADVVPEAISGDKDAVDADGNPDYQGIDQSKLVPLLVATIQELEARITQLENN